MPFAVELDFASQGVYQLLVANEDEYWTYLQLDDQGKITDCVCSCEDQEEGKACEHIRISMQKIMNGHTIPWHVRFRLSLWNVLAQIYASKVGFDVDVLHQISSNHFEAHSSSGKTVFSIEVKNRQSGKLHEILFKRAKETEETSIKFSKLSLDEILLWKEGRPSFPLRYELSFWSDLAKWMMNLQEDKVPYTIKFAYSKKELPNWISISFEDLQMRFYLSEAHLPIIIPALATVKSPLKVFSAKEAQITEMTYDKIKKTFSIIRDIKDASQDQASMQDVSNAIIIDDWTYVPKKGFYGVSREAFIKGSFIEEDKIPKLLEEHEMLLERYLVGCKIDKEPRELQYELFFDQDDDLHIEAYLEEKKDLSSQYSTLFGSWVYLEDVGFFKVEDIFYGSLKTVILKKNVSEFVSQNRLWLNSQEGFATHMTSIEADLTFFLGSDLTMRFASKLERHETHASAIDFSDWIYIQNEGFYSKRHGRLGSFIQPGMSIPPADISLFIHMHQEDLELIRGFFSTSCPIDSVKLSVELNSNDTITVMPIYKVKEGYHLADLHFFDDFVYTKDQGFHLLPHEMRLPRRFRTKVIIEKNQLDFFLGTELAQLHHYIAEIDPRLKMPKNLSLTMHHLRKGEDGLLGAELLYETEEGFLDCQEIWRSIKEAKRFLFTTLGLIDLQDNRFQWLKGLAESKIDRKSHELKLTSLELIRLQIFNDVKVELGPKSKESEKLWQSLCNFTTDERIDLSYLKSNLRPYQETGIRWLWFLYSLRLSGLLCDDMGLGKTHQAMALIAAVYARRENKRFLVVCPTSVIYHWEEKLKQFLPDLRVYTLYGPNRSLDEFEGKFDLLLTSYGVMRVEQKNLNKIGFEVAIFDEVQIAKNFQSQTHKALLGLNARMKLGLTGTPIENRLRELKALFDITLPSYMPSDAQFRSLFVQPIEKHNDKQAKELLHRFIKPFVLRRKKEDVLLELPEKTEEIALAELLEDQKKLYQDTLSHAKDSLIKDLKDNAKPVPYTSLFALLTKLKQICDHPSVFLKDPSRFKEFQSGKWNLFLELLDEAIACDQKVVVFSHYLFMIDIIETHLKEQNIFFASIRGDTKDRAAELRSFQEDPNCKVFIGSLQAVGLGVELTAASIVIHYDRWWNAARENQATDRVYRMGQKRGVQVFKLVTKHTLEEYISRLIEKKGGLMEEIIGFDDEDTLKKLTREEWLEILQLSDQSSDN